MNTQKDVDDSIIENLETPSIPNIEELKKNFDSLSDDDISRISDDVNTMIPQIDNRINYWENRRIQFLEIALAILAVSLAGMVALLPDILLNLINKDFFANSMFIYMPFLIICFVLIASCIYTLVVWINQNNPEYPFNRSSYIWKWHYRNAETVPISTDISKGDEAKQKEQYDIYINNSIDYKNKFLKCKPIDLLDQDISQLYLLLTNEKYKVNFVSELRDLLRSGIVISMIFGIVSFILYFAVYIISIIKSIPST